MTLVLSFLKSGQLGVIGDTLLSAPKTTVGLKAPLPGDFLAKNLIPDPVKIHGLCQKIVTLSSRAVLTWAGSLMHVREFISEIATVVSDFNGEFDQLKRKIEPFSTECQIALHYVKDGLVSTTYWNAAPMSYSDWENVFLLGSGSVHGWEAVEGVEENVAEMQGLPFPLYLASAASQIQINAQVFGITSSLAYGGAFELAMSLPDQIVKLSNIVTMEWIYRPDAEGLVALVLVGLNHVSYWNGDTVISFLSVDKSGKATWNRRMATPPQTFQGRPSFPPVHKGDYPVGLITHLVWQHDLQKRMTLVLTDGRQPLRLSIDDNRFSHHLTERYRLDLLAEIKAVFEANEPNGFPRP